MQVDLYCESCGNRASLLVSCEYKMVETTSFAILSALGEAPIATNLGEYATRAHLEFADAVGCPSLANLRRYIKDVSNGGLLKGLLGGVSGSSGTTFVEGLLGNIAAAAILSREVPAVVDETTELLFITRTKLGETYLKFCIFLLCTLGR